MPIASSARTGSYIASTVIAAVGLNLGVLNINRDSSSDQTDADLSAELSSTESVTAAGDIALPVTTVVALASPTEQAAEPTDQSSPTQVVSPAQDGASGVGQPDTSAKPAPATSVAKVVEPVTTSEPADSPQTQPPNTLPPESQPPNTQPPETRPPETQPTAPPTTKPPVTQPAVPPETTAQPPTTQGPVTEYLTYEFEGIASIIIALHDRERLEFWSAIPEPGWAFMVEDETSHKIKIKFRPTNGGDEAEFQAKLEGGGKVEIKREY